MRYASLVFFLLPFFAGSTMASPTPGKVPNVNEIAEAYVKLVLAMGKHDPDYVDAYYGPPEWKKQAEKPLNAIALEAAKLRDQLSKIPKPAEQMEQLRNAYLTKQLSALETRVRIVKGEHLSFDEESQALYDAIAPKLSESHFQEILASLAAKLPGEGPLMQRYENWRQAFVIPKDKLDTVFQLAIKECRKRTLAHVKLPPGENFSVEYVSNKPWTGYNWYKGNYRSVIQVNTDLPVYIDRAIDLAAHEGYPGHHVYNVLLEKNLLRDRGWIEFSVYPLFSPQSLIAEGTANFGREVVFTKAERLEFEKKGALAGCGDRSIPSRRILRRSRSYKKAGLRHDRSSTAVRGRPHRRQWGRELVAKKRAHG